MRIDEDAGAEGLVVAELGREEEGSKEQKDFRDENGGRANKEKH